eukprot:COSAG01_NODE_7677_length_3102_cov_2.143523_2_plen_66_part_00
MSLHGPNGKVYVTSVMVWTSGTLMSVHLSAQSVARCRALVGPVGIASTAIGLGAISLEALAVLIH